MGEHQCDRTKINASFSSWSGSGHKSPPSQRVQQARLEHKKVLATAHELQSSVERIQKEIASLHAMPPPLPPGLRETVREDVVDAGRCATDCICGNAHALGCTAHKSYSIELLLLHREIHRKISQGAPGLEPDPEQVVRDVGVGTPCVLQSMREIYRSTAPSR